MINMIFSSCPLYGRLSSYFRKLNKRKPVIIFREIKHVRKNFKGVYVSQRNYMDLKKFNLS